MVFGNAVDHSKLIVVEDGRSACALAHATLHTAYPHTAVVGGTEADESVVGHCGSVVALIMELAHGLGLVITDDKSVMVSGKPQFSSAYEMYIP